MLNEKIHNAYDGDREAVHELANELYQLSQEFKKSGKIREGMIYALYGSSLLSASMALQGAKFSHRNDVLEKELNDIRKILAELEEYQSII